MPKHMSSVARKNIMALTGLVLCVFLVVHVLGNAMLLRPMPDAQLSFNRYATRLGDLSVIRIAGYITSLSILVHVVMAAMLTSWNTRSAGSRYVYPDPGATSPWHTRWMGALGVVLLVFLVVHLRDFWFPYRFDDSIGLDAEGHKDLYSIVAVASRRWWYVGFYVVAMGALACHLYQGVYSALRSLGLHHPVYARWARRSGQAFAVAISLAFAAMPVYLYLIQWTDR